MEEAHASCPPGLTDAPHLATSFRRVMSPVVLPGFAARSRRALVGRVPNQRHLSGIVPYLQKHHDLTQAFQHLKRTRRLDSGESLVLLAPMPEGPLCSCESACTPASNQAGTAGQAAAQAAAGCACGCHSCVEDEGVTTSDVGALFEAATRRVLTEEASARGSASPSAEAPGFVCRQLPAWFGDALAAQPGSSIASFWPTQITALYEVTLPATPAAHDPRAADAESKLVWPATPLPPALGTPPPVLAAVTPQEARYFARGLAAAAAVAAQAGVSGYFPSGCVLVQPPSDVEGFGEDEPLVIRGQGFSRTHVRLSSGSWACVTPLHTAVHAGIGQVADWVANELRAGATGKARKEENAEGEGSAAVPVPLSSPAVPSTMAGQKRPRSPSPALAATTPSSPSSSLYLCTGMDAFLTHEPDLSDAMALVHSRVSRVIYTSPDPRAGCLGSSVGKPGVLQQQEVTR